MKKIYSIILSLIVFASSILTAEQTPIKNLSAYTLDNGLELYVAENHTVPLVYIEICVRGGGIAQTKENAGLFHLYEHMMFKGNSKYPTSEEMQTALSDLGCSNWNGSTGQEYINYFFTIPSAKLKEGLEFWSYAIRTPNMDKREFEAEKKVVISEIEGDKNDPNMVLYNFLSSKLFKEAPWARSPGGDAKIVKKATIEQLRKIQNEYYIPNNSALFVGGDVNPDEVYKLVNEIYGLWEKGADPWENNKKQFSLNPLKQTEYYVMPYDQIAPQIAQVQISFRGPDAEFNTSSTYAADLLFSLTENPQSIYKQSLCTNQALGIPDPNYTGISYYTQKRLGIINAYAVMLSPEYNIAERTKAYVQLVPEFVKQSIPENADSEDVKLAKTRFENQEYFTQETAENLLGTLRFWWICSGSNYYYNYLSNMEELNSDDIKQFYTDYVENTNAVVILLINPEVYEKAKKDLSKNGFKLIK